MESIRIKGENESKWVDTFVDIVLDEELQLHQKMSLFLCLSVVFKVY